MASFRKVGRAWRAEVSRGGQRASATRATKAAAIAWAMQKEADIDSGKSGRIPDKTFGDLLERYAEEVSPRKAGARWERIRIETITRGRAVKESLTPADPIAARKLALLDERDFAGWRDRRLRSVSEASVRREWNLLSNACNVAVREWRWLTENPMKRVRRPGNSAPRYRRISDDELARLLHCMGYDREAPLATRTARVGAAVLLAIETAMRCGELAALQWSDVLLERSFCRVGRGKSEAARREVPLSLEALRVLRQLAAVRDGPLVLQLTAASVDALFRKARDKALIEDLHFHDTRHEAVTRLARIFDILALARIIGHKDLRMLQVYYNPTAEELVQQMRDKSKPPGDGVDPEAP